MLKPLQIEGARALADANAIDHVKVIASAEGLYVEINRKFTVSNRMKQARIFAKADTCFSWLREMGISRIHEVDLSLWGTPVKPESPIVSGVLAFWKFSASALMGDEWMRLAQKAESLSNKGRHAEAAIAANQALQLAEDSLKPDDPDIAVILNCLGSQHFAMGQFDQAEPLYKRALENAEKTLGPNDPFVGVCLNNLAEAYDAQGKSEQTEGMYLRALRITETSVDADFRSDKSNLAIILTNLASWYARQGSNEQAEQLYKRAIEIWDNETGLLFPDPPKAAISFEGLVDIYRKTDREQQARALEKRAAKIKARKKSDGQNE